MQQNELIELGVTFVVCRDLDSLNNYVVGSVYMYFYFLPYVSVSFMDA
jgi:hypothetical protein